MNAVFRCQTEPHMCEDVISWNTFPSPVFEPQVILRIPESLFCRLTIPSGCFFVVLWNSVTFVIHPAQIVLRSCVSLLGRVAEPLQRLVVALRNALAVKIHSAQVELRISVSILRQGTKLLQGHRIVAVFVRPESLLEPHADGRFRGDNASRGTAYNKDGETGKKEGNSHL